LKRKEKEDERNFLRLGTQKMKDEVKAIKNEWRNLNETEEQREERELAKLDTAVGLVRIVLSS
jgi:hypothetical protein